MPPKSTTPPPRPAGAVPVKRLSRKAAAKLSTAEFISEASPAVRRLLSYVKPYRGRFFVGIVFGILFGLSNALVFSGMKLLFDMVLPSAEKATAIKVPLIGQIQTPSALPHDQAFWLVVASCAFLPLMILGRGLLGYLNSYCMMWVGQKVLNDLRTQTFAQLMRQSMSFYSKTKTGELIQTVFNQTRMVAQAGSDLAANLVKFPISILTLVVWLFVQDWKFALCALLVFPLCMIPVVQIGRKVRGAGGKEEEEAGMLMVTMHEAFSGIRLVKSLGREDYEIERFSKGADMLERLVMRWRKALQIVGPLVETVASFGIAAGLAYAWATGMTAQKFLVLYGALVAIYPHAKGLSQLQIMLQKCVVAASKVFEIVDRPLDIADDPAAVPLANARGAVEFDDGTCAYEKGARPAVSGISLRMEPGRKYALVGQSGAGKSTLFSLLMRFYDPDQGAVRIDGRDIREYQQQSLRENIGIVNQDIFLFHDTIFNNIRYGKLDATKEEVEDAARRAHAHEFILEQRLGYKTVIGDKGLNISGGQQQRLSIARAFVRNAPILLLDEATSALDSEAERIIQASLDELCAGRTVIAIAHRLSTILNADAIVVMDKGRVLAVGTHRELLESCPEYRYLYDLQFKQQPEENFSAAAMI